MLSADRVAGSPGKLLLAGVIWAVEQGCRRSPAEGRGSAADRAREEVRMLLPPCVCPEPERGSADEIRLRPLVAG